MKAHIKEMNKEKILFTRLEHFIFYPCYQATKLQHKGGFPLSVSLHPPEHTDPWNFNATGHCVDQKCKSKGNKLVDPWTFEPHILKVMFLLIYFYT